MGKKILIVEDHEDSRAMMRLAVESFGYEVVEAQNGLEAIELVKDDCPELILMDINMPGLDGLSTAAKIKTFAHCENLPIIAVTAYSDFRDRALEAGFTELMRKPVEFLQLREVIEAHIG